jgi:hypothetical protein
MEAGGASRIRRPGRASAAGAWALALLVGCSLAAGAAAGATPIAYPDFSSVAGLKLNGNAAQSGTALRLVGNTQVQHGSAWAQTQIDTTQSFESRFRADVHDGSLPSPADGMTFAIQSKSLSAIGDSGGAHGYAGLGAISPSVAVDVSLFPQIFNGGNEQFSLVSNGTLAPLAKATSSVLLYGQPFSVWVDYDAKTHTVAVFVSQATTKPPAPLVSASIDLAATVGPAAYAGFTAGTGANWADFDVLGWTVETVDDATPPTVTCSASPNVLWPPNNKLVPVTTRVTVSDSGSGAAGFSLVSVTSNEGEAAAESSGWVPGTPDTSGFLQASRLGSGHGRVYTLTYEGRDNAGNKATCATTVAVPHDQGTS